MRASNEVRVGIVMFLALTLMVVGYFFLRGLGLGADLYYLRLNGAANVAPGNDVRLQGIKIGQVQEVTLDPNTRQPLLTLAVRRATPRFELLTSYKYTIQASALIGDSYVDIRGKYATGAPAYEANDPDQVIPGAAVAGLPGITDEATNMIKDMRTTLTKFNVTLDRVNKGVLSYENQVKLTRAIDSTTRLTERVGQSFGPQGFAIRFGDPRSQRALNETLANAAFASREANAAARNMRQLTVGLNSTLSENRGQVRQLLGSLKGAADNVAGLTQSLNFVVREGGLQENLRLTLNSVRKAAENVEATTAGFKAITGDVQTQTNIRTALISLREATESLRDTAASIKKAVADPEVEGQLKGILTTLNVTARTLQTTAETVQLATAGPLTSTAGNVQAASQNLVAMSQNFNAASQNLTTTSQSVQNSATSLEKIVTDPKLMSDLKAIPTELRGTLEATRATAERINSLLGGRKKRNEPTQGGQEGGVKAQHSGYAPGGVDFTARSFRNVSGGPRLGDNAGRNFGDLTFNSEFFGGPFRLGLANIGDSTDLTLQTGKFLGRDTALRYGLYRSKLGAGVDLHKGRFSLEGNLWNPNRRSYNAYLGLRITPQVELLLGHENIRHVRANAVGVRLTP
ncbi:MAG: MlaD family protein [Armatimonadota bacterium]|nr:MlaD family protein [Armatimonadota bacterium]